jgi:hypothetical protein
MGLLRQKRGDFFVNVFELFGAKLIIMYLQAWAARDYFKIQL